VCVCVCARALTTVVEGIGTSDERRISDSDVGENPSSGLESCRCCRQTAPVGTGRCGRPTLRTNRRRAGSTPTTVSDNRRTIDHSSESVASPRGGLGSTCPHLPPLLLELAPEIDTVPTSFYRGGGEPPDSRYRLWLRARHLSTPHISTRRRPCSE